MPTASASPVPLTGFEIEIACKTGSQRSNEFRPSRSSSAQLLSVKQKPFRQDYVYPMILRYDRRELQLNQCAVKGQSNDKTTQPGVVRTKRSRWFPVPQLDEESGLAPGSLRRPA